MKDWSNPTAFLYDAYIMMNTDHTDDKRTILVVDDDRRIRELLSRFLHKNGFGVSLARNVSEAREILSYIAFDLLIVDVMMPGEDGVSFTKKIRQENPQQPMLMLTALGDSDDRIKGLEAGADDYLPKPFEPRELLLRVQSILRRQPKTSKKDDALKLGVCVFDSNRDVLLCGEKTVALTFAESKLLKVLSSENGKVWSRESLLQETGIDGNERTIDVQVTRLRRKIEQDPKAPLYLQTIRGQGYVLKPD